MFQKVFQLLFTNPLPVMEDCLRILLKIVDNILKEPQRDKWRALRKSNATISDKVLSVRGGRECLVTLGFKEGKENFVLPSNVSLNSLTMFKSELDAWKQSNYKMETNEEVIEKVKLPPLTLSYTNKFLNRIEISSHNVLRYNDKKLQERAKNLVPLRELEENAAVTLRDIQINAKKNKLPEPNLTCRDTLILELLRWFKSDFFEWVDSPECDKCNSETVLSHVTKPTKDHVYADQVEFHKCKSCNFLTPFARYNDVNILLETRRGRCGEWANTFTLFCISLNYDARFVIDEGDHVWTEVYSTAQKRWLHCDPCENVCDRPLMYENGWKKKITYVIAYSPEDIQDVTWRYTSNHKEVLKRRRNCSEIELVNALIGIRQKLQENLSDSRKKYLTKRTLEELVEFLTEKKPNELDLEGRTSGSEIWRLTRGEISKKITSSYEWNVEECNERVSLRYSASLDRYELICDGKVSKCANGWENGVFQAAGVFRKKETDWKMVYLAREENANVGTISWKINIKPDDKTIKNIKLNFDYATFENGEVNVNISSESNHFSLPKGQKQCELKEFHGSKKITVTATLTGGKGDVAWQHAQLFRQSTDDSQFPFSIELEL